MFPSPEDQEALCARHCPSSGGTASRRDSLKAPLSLTYLLVARRQIIGKKQTSKAQSKLDTKGTKAAEAGEAGVR